MKIIHINSMETTNPGGINKVVQEIAIGQSNLGNEVIVLQPNPCNLSTNEKFYNFRIIRTKSSSSKFLYGFNIPIIFVLRNIIKKFSPDIIHIHGYHTLLSAEIIFFLKRMLKMNITVIFSPHLDTAYSTLGGKYFSFIYRLLIGKRIFSLVDKTLAVSEFERMSLIKTFKLLDKSVPVISHGVDFININKIPRNDNKLKLIYSGHLIKRKRVDNILFSLNSLIFDFHIINVNLNIIGEGPEKEKLISIARRLNIIDYITWEDFLPREVQIEKIKNSDIFLLLSESEAFGITIAETLALGTPCIITDTTALTEFIKEPGCFGVTFPPNPKMVAKLIIQIFKEKKQLGPFSDRIRTWDRVCEDYNQLYNQLIKR